MQESKVTSKGQTTLPRGVRSKLGLEAGDTVRYIVSGERVQILKARRASDLGGMLYRPGQRRVSLEEMDDLSQKAPLKARHDSDRYKCSDAVLDKRRCRSIRNSCGFG